MECTRDDWHRHRHRCCNCALADPRSRDSSLCRQHHLTLPCLFCLCVAYMLARWLVLHVGVPASWQDYVPDTGILDTVTKVFWESQAADWDRLLAGSSLWHRISEPLLARAKEKAEQVDNPDERLEQLRFVRRLKAASDRLQRNKVRMALGGSCHGCSGTRRGMETGYGNCAQSG